MRSEEMLHYAAGLVSGDRAKNYGDKAQNHERIAALWRMWLAQRGKPSDVGAYDVAMMMILVKIARLMHSPGHADSHTDIAGYAAICEEIASMAGVEA